MKNKLVVLRGMLLVLIGAILVCYPQDRWLMVSTSKHTKDNILMMPFDIGFQWSSLLGMLGCVLITIGILVLYSVFLQQGLGDVLKKNYMEFIGIVSATLNLTVWKTVVKHENLYQSFKEDYYAIWKEQVMALFIALVVLLVALTILMLVKRKVTELKTWPCSVLIIIVSIISLRLKTIHNSCYFVECLCSIAVTMLVFLVFIVIEKKKISKSEENNKDVNIN